MGGYESRRGPAQILQQVNRAMELNEKANRVLIPEYWFAEDAYGAAVAGILKSIELGLASGSIGVGDEEYILTEVRKKLLELDPALEGK